MGSVAHLNRESQADAGDRVYAEIAPICGHLNVLHAQLVRCTVDALATNAWGGVGITSPEHWLCLLAGVSSARAAQIVAVARRWHELPRTMAAFSVGELSLEQTFVVAKTVRSCNDAEACRVARHALVSQLSNALRKYRYGPDPAPRPRPRTEDDEHTGEDAAPTADDESAPGPGPNAGGGEPFTAGGVGEPGAGARGGPADDAADGPAAGDDPAPDAAPDPRAARAAAPNRVSFTYDEDGRYCVPFDLDPLTGALVDKALREARNALFNAGRPSTFADAIGEMAARSLAAVTNADRRDLYRVYLRLDVEGAWIDQGPAVPSRLFDQITCDGTVILLAERNGRPVEIFRPTSVVTNHLRRLVLDRDRRCRFPGCGRDVHLEVRHVVHRAHLGPSTLPNLASLCPLHHDLVHRGAITVTGNADTPGWLHLRRGRDRRDHPGVPAARAARRHATTGATARAPMASPRRRAFPPRLPRLSRAPAWL
jgi:hypothetical protein